VKRRQFFKIFAIAAVSDAWHANGQTMEGIMHVKQDQQWKVVITRQYTIETSHGSLAVEEIGQGEIPPL
jgi:hypothetical protein